MVCEDEAAVGRTGRTRLVVVRSAMALDAPKVTQVGEELVDQQAQVATVANQVRGVLVQAAAPWSHLADASVATSSSSQFHWHH